MRRHTRRGIPRPSWKLKSATAKAVLRSPWTKVAAALVLIVAISGGVVFMHYYNIYATIIDRRLSGDVFNDTAKIYATPYIVYADSDVDPNAVILRLRRAGLEPRDETPSEDNTYQLLTGELELSLIVSPEGRPDFRIDFQDTRVDQIQEVLTGFELPSVDLPPELVTNLFDDSRSKRRLLEWEQLPPVLTDALVASEDQRFYRHFGIDLIRATGVFISNMRGGSLQGASTLTMQLAGSFFLDRQNRTWSRKGPEIFMALILEQRLSKSDILTMYANEIYLGHRGSFAIYGFGEAASAYFGKDVADLTLSEAATLVGLIPAPNRYSPLRNMERAIERRDIVLTEMHDLGMINMTLFTQASQSEIALADVRVDESEAPYMVDFIRDQLLSDFSEEDLVSEGLKVYTTIDPDLQKAAVEAVAAGIIEVDQQLEALGRGTSSGRPPVQASLIALDPHTGEIKAMVGGRDYGDSQYNRITEAFRQPGSIFKPFVYAAAFESAFDPLPVPEEEPETFEESNQGTLTSIFQDGIALLTGSNEEEATVSQGPAAVDVIDEEEEEEIDPRPTLTQAEYFSLRQPREDDDAADGLLEEMDYVVLPDRDELGTIRRSAVITPMTTVMDEPTLFFYEEEKFYEPNNYADVFFGIIPIREALQRSLNVPTVKVAERIGYGRVADLAHRVGLNADIQPYPSVALGSFEVTPIEMAGAYTALANEGVRVEPRAVTQVRDRAGNVLQDYELESEEVLRPELASLMTNLLQNVVNRGTGAGVRARGFTLPAAGKTGTSRDGWFAGYTKDLLAIAWVGFDDNRELDLEGSRSALPIWTSFMLQADALYPVRQDEDINFVQHPGVEFVSIDAGTLSLATPYCPDRYTQAFIHGTAPLAYCPIHSFPAGFFISDNVEGSETPPSRPPSRGAGNPVARPLPGAAGSATSPR